MCEKAQCINIISVDGEHFRSDECALKLDYNFLLNSIFTIFILLCSIFQMLLKWFFLAEKCWKKQRIPLTSELRIQDAEEIKLTLKYG